MSDWKISEAGSVFAGLLFGALKYGGSKIQDAMLPYILTIIVLVGVVGKTTPPAAIGRIFDKSGN